MAKEKKPSKKTSPRKKATRKGDAKAPEAALEASRKLLDLEPDRLPLTERRARYLAEKTGVDAKKIVGKPLAEVHDALRWKLDPKLFLFRRICGRVVKKDPVTGQLLPVPNATVHVEDTDCHFLGYFPHPVPWVWLYPFHCHREVIATVTTDDCGRFCVHLPFWDVDRILTWRRLRICYWQYLRPRVRDLLELERLPELLEMGVRPWPQPDPPPFARITAHALERVRDLAGEITVQRLEAARSLNLQGDAGDELEAVLDEPIFPKAAPPPLPKEMVESRGELPKELREKVLAHLDDRELTLERLDFRRFIGPFLRCHDIFVGTWHTVLDVPDITFRVTQDVDGDGVEELIYSEGFFDVRWGSGSIPDVTLEASGNAVASLQCGPVQEIPCGNVPSIESAGYLDLEAPYHDDASGYCVRVNRPSPTGDYPPPPSVGNPVGTAATAPYTGNLNLHGCARLNNATHYRLQQKYKVHDGDPWGPRQVIHGVTWMAPRQGPGPAIPFVPDGDGWYALVDPADLVHPHWLLPWNASARSNGLYRLELELGRLTGGAINPVGTSAPRVFRVDNDAPSASLVEVRWRPATTVGAWTDANSTLVLPAPPATCPVIERPAGQDIHLRVVWTVTATHLRDATLVHSGCGGGNLDLLDGGIEAYRHWHTGPLDNNVSQTNHYLLRAIRPAGCYTLGIQAWSRACNPQDSNAASTHDWWVNQGVRWTHPFRAISVVDA